MPLCMLTAGTVAADLSIPFANLNLCPASLAYTSAFLAIPRGLSEEAAGGTSWLTTHC